MQTKLIIGLAGTTLTATEQQWLRQSPPAGIILFARNATSPEQVRSLIDQARTAAGTHLWAAIDEEGGRVFRLPWSPFNQRPTAAAFAQRYATNPTQTAAAVRDDAEQCGEALAALGFTHNCAPVLDLRHPDGHAVIGNRAFGDSVSVVTDLGNAVLDGLTQAGIAAVGKHFPGHGRAACDSHLTTPEVTVNRATLLAEAAPFSAMISHGLQHIMTAHVRYPQQDAAIASCSNYWINELRTSFNFQGTIWSDDLSMGGAGDDLSTALQAAHNAGSDRLLVCQPKDCNTIFNGEAQLD
ncbi:MAG: beta-N-acetylhexosaminidase [Mariprofundales bacterium]